MNELQLLYASFVAIVIHLAVNATQRDHTGLKRYLITKSLYLNQNTLENHRIMTRSIIISAITLFIATACNQSQNNTTANHSPIDTTAFKMPVPQTSDALSIYKTYINKLDTLDVYTASLAAHKYQELFQDEQPTFRDSGYILFSNYYKKLDRNLNELHVKDTGNYHAFIPGYTSKKENTPTDKQKQYVEDLHKNGFQLASAEGMTYIQPDFDVVNSWFAPYVSPALKEYLEQLNKENKEGFAADAGLVISPEQYADRVIWWENFIKNNPSFVLLDEAKEKQKHLLTFFILGMDNTPIRSYKDGSLEPYYKTAYDYLQKTYSNTEANQLVAPYYKALLQNDTATSNSLLKRYRSKGYILIFEE
jgi:hypothetical protein